jgi:hypothetical protein
MSSLYYFIRRNPRHFLHNEIISKDISLKEFVGSDSLTTILSNVQTRLISGVEEIDRATGSE